MMKDLVWIGGRAVHHCSVSVRWERFSWSVVRCLQATEELVLIPFAQQHIVPPFEIRIPYAEFCQLWALFDRGGARDVAKTATVRATNSDIEWPIGKALVDEVVSRDDRWVRPEADWNVLLFR